LRRGDVLPDDPVGRDLRIVVRVVFKEELDEPRRENRAPRDRGLRLTNDPAATPRTTTSSGIMVQRRTSISLSSSSSPPLT